MRLPILHVAPALWSGAGSVITRLAEDQARRGPVVIVTAARRGLDRDWPEYRRRLRAVGVRHHRIDFLSRDRAIFRASVDRLRRVIDSLRPAVIHAHAGVPSLGAALARAASCTQPRLIGQMYSWGPNRPGWMNIEDALGFGATDRVVCSARAYQGLLQQHGVRKAQLTYLPWGLPLDQFPFGGVGRTAGNAAGPRLGFVGRVEPRKDQIRLVQVLAELQQQSPAATLELVGPVADRAYADEIAALIRRRAIRGVTLTGQVRRPADRVRDWDVFVSLSTDEGQGLAVLEAMALGVLVAARPVAGIADFLTDGLTGVALPSSSIRAISRGIASAWRDARACGRMTRQARRLVERRYDWAQTVAAFDWMYEMEEAP